MSEAPITYRPGPARIFEHGCEHCDDWGAFGYGVSLRAGRPGKWYCAKHRPEVFNTPRPPFEESRANLEPNCKN